MTRIFREHRCISRERIDEWSRIDRSKTERNRISFRLRQKQHLIYEAIQARDFLDLLDCSVSVLARVVSQNLFGMESKK